MKNLFRTIVMVLAVAIVLPIQLSAQSDDS